VEYRALIQSAFRLHCKIEPSDVNKVKHIFFKATPYQTPEIKVISKLFPEFVLVFNTRHPVPSLRSFMKFGEIATTRLFWKLGILWRWLVNGKYGFYFEPEFDKDLAPYSKWYMNMTYIELLARIYCRVVKAYFLHKNEYKKVILYEKLCQNPTKELKEIFSLLKVDEKNVALALEALKQDSQNGIFGGIGSMRNKNIPRELWDKWDDLFIEHNLPLRRDISIEEFSDLLGVKCT